MLDGIGENISFANAILACILLGTYDNCLGALRLIDAIYHLIQTTHALDVLRIYIEKVGLKGCFLRDALDFLSVQDNVDAERIGIIGICGFGGMAVNAAALDPRIKATVAMTMYDMSKVNVEGYFESENTPEQRLEKRRAIAAQRTADYKSGTYQRAGGVIDSLPEDAPFFVKDYFAYYKTPRGYHERSGNSTDGWNVIGTQSFLNQPLLAWAHEIDRPVLLIHGERAHSRYFSEYAFEKMTGVHVENESKVVGNKEIMIIPGASHVDLYDDVAGVIPYDKIEAFFTENLK